MEDGYEKAKRDLANWRHAEGVQEVLLWAAETAANEAVHLSHGEDEDIDEEIRKRTASMLLFFRHYLGYEGEASEQQALQDISQWQTGVLFGGAANPGYAGDEALEAVEDALAAAIQDLRKQYPRTRRTKPHA